MNNNSLDLSVILSVRNGSQTINKAIDSILNQTYKNFELLILDDCSTDNTYNICNYYKNDKRVRLFRNSKNLGLTRSLNLLANEAKGKYLARQDSDDFSLPNRLQIQYELLENSNYKVSSTRAYIDNSNIIKPRYIYYLPNKIALALKNPFIHGSLMIEKYLFDEIGGYEEKYYFSQDYHLYTKIIKLGHKIYSFKEPLYVLNTKNNLSSKYKHEQNRLMKEIRKNYIKDVFF